MIPRYSRPEMARIWEPENRFRIWFEIEAHACDAQAALGATLEVPTLQGRSELEIPGGTQSGAVFRLGGKGLPDPRRRGLGDLLVQVVIEVPKKLSREEQTLLRELAELEHKHVAPERKGWFDKLKEYFSTEERSAS